VREVHFRRGVLTARTAAVETKTYTSTTLTRRLNPDRRASGEAGLQAAGPQAVRNHRVVYRFEVKLAAGATRKLPVTEERGLRQQLRHHYLTPDILTTYIRTRL